MNKIFDFGRLKDYLLPFLIIKWTPIIFTFGLTVHCFLMMFGINVQVLSYLCMTPPIGAILFLYLSHKLKLCWIHKSMVGYVLTISICDILYRHGAFDDTLFQWSLGMFLVGLFLCITLILHVFLWKGDKDLQQC